MNEIEVAWLVLFGTLGGAFLGLLGGVVQSVLLATAESKRHMQRLAMEVALKDWDFYHEYVKTRGRGLVVPAALHVNFNAKAIEAALSGGLTPAKWRELRVEQSALGRVALELSGLETEGAAGG